MKKPKGKRHRHHYHEYETEYSMLDENDILINCGIELGSFEVEQNGHLTSICCHCEKEKP